MTSSGSTSKRSGLAAALCMRNTRCERPSRPAISPQHSSGASARACATISSMCSGANSMSPPSLFRCFDGGDVFVLVALGVAAQRLLELPHPLPERAAHFGQLLRAEDDQRDG